MTMRKLVLGIVAAGAMLVSGQVQAANIFLDDVTAVNSGVVEDMNPTIVYGSTGMKTLAIWVTDEVLVNRGLAMSFTSSNTGVLALVSASASNPNINTTFNTGDLGDSGADRWQAVGTNILASGGGAAINNLNAADSRGTDAATSFGINSLNNGLQPGLGKKDMGYDVPAGAFLYGTVTFNLLSLATPVVIDIVPSNLGIANNGGDVSESFSLGQATINVIPEPASLGLLAAGTLMMLRRRRA